MRALLKISKHIARRIPLCPRNSTHICLKNSTTARSLNFTKTCYLNLKRLILEILPRFAFKISPHLALAINALLLIEFTWCLRSVAFKRVLCKIPHRFICTRFLFRSPHSSSLCMSAPSAPSLASSLS